MENVFHSKLLKYNIYDASVPYIVHDIILYKRIAVFREKKKKVKRKTLVNKIKRIELF